MKLLRKRIESFEKLLGCHVCVHEYPGELRKFAGCIHFHSNIFCENVKTKKGNGQTCLESDYRLLKNRMDASRIPFLKICHAGYIEGVCPIFINDTHIATAFAGPYTLKPSSSRPGCDLIEDPFYKKDKDNNRISHKMPPVADARFLEHLLNMLELLGNAMENFLQKSIQSGDPGWQDPKTRILFFFEHDFRKDIYLEDLAKFLGVGTSRASQLLRIHFRSNFPKMLNERRMEHSKRMLADTDMKVSSISEECGYSDPAYFFRLFRKINGTTPDGFRRKLKTNSGRGSDI